MLTEIVEYIKSWILEKEVPTMSTPTEPPRIVTYNTSTVSRRSNLTTSLIDYYQEQGIPEARRYQTEINRYTPVVQQTSMYISVTNNNDTCPICYECNNINSCRPSCCTHVFHKNCLSSWAVRYRSCPVCRRGF